MAATLTVRPALHDEYDRYVAAASRTVMSSGRSLIETAELNATSKPSRHRCDDRLDG